MKILEEGHIRHSEHDFGYVFQVQTVGGGEGPHYMVAVKVAAVAALMDDGRREFRVAGMASVDFTPDFDKAELVIEATVKWDGCLDGSLSEHVCNRSDALKLAFMLASLHDIARKHVHADAELYEGR